MEILLFLCVSLISLRQRRLVADLCGWKIRFKVILIDWESFDDILMHFNDQIREKTWWVNARKILIRKDSTENQSVCFGAQIS